MKVSWKDVLKDPNEFTIQSLWSIYFKMCFPKGCSNAQETEMRRSYYAAFVDCFSFMTEISSELSEDEASKILDKVQTEAHRFCELEIKRMKSES